MRIELRDWMRELVDGATKIVEPPTTEPSAAELALDVSGVRLRAWITPDRQLVAEIDVARGFGPSTEKELYEALDQRSGSLVAGLLLWEWRTLRAECEARSRASAPPLFAAAV